MAQTNLRLHNVPDISVGGRLLNEKEASKHLYVAVKTLQRWRWQGIGPPHYKIGRAVRYALVDLDRFLAASKRRSTSDPGPRKGQAGGGSSDAL